ncbi:TPA: conjugal transfer protein TraH, partial [Klebsiella pneumoniae]
MATDFPKVTFMKKLLLSAMFFGVFSMQQVHAANVMEGIFKGMVASTDPASVRTASRVGAVGGSFSYRQPQVNTNLVNVSFPKASVGCNGIDIFLGSFSMI